MSVLMEQHQDWKPRNARLWGGNTPEQPKRVKAVLSRPVSPFAARPRWSRLFIRPIEQLDDYGNIVVENFFIPQWKRIALEVCEKHHVSFTEITSRRRSKYVVIARHEAFWRCRNETPMSFPQIGARFGGRDHTTVLHGVWAHEQRMGEATQQ